MKLKLPDNTNSNNDDEYYPFSAVVPEMPLDGGAERYKWASDTFGPEFKRWYRSMLFANHGIEYRFEKSADAAFFLLKWGA